jgi:hypothetical protein
MKKLLLFVVFMMINFLNLSAQINDTNRLEQSCNLELKKLVSKIESLDKTVKILEQKNIKSTIEIETLKSQIKSTNSQVILFSDSLDHTQKVFSTDSKNTHKKIDDVSSSFASKFSYLILAFLLGLTTTVMVFLYLKKSLHRNKSDIVDQIAKTRVELENESVKLDSKLVEVLQNQLMVSKFEKSLVTNKELTIDHKLPLKVGEEIHRMRKRIENMPSDIKGLSALNNSLQRLEEEFNDNGYEIEKLEGVKYVDGMKVEARFVDNPDIPQGEEIITDVIRPAIKYKGVLIQVAKVEVSKS